MQGKPAIEFIDHWSGLWGEPAGTARTILGEKISAHSN